MIISQSGNSWNMAFECLNDVHYMVSSSITQLCAVATENPRLSQTSDQCLKILRRSLLDPQKLIVVLLTPQVAILRTATENTNNNKPNHRRTNLIAALSQLLVRIVQQLPNRSILTVNFHTRLHLPSDFDQLVLRNCSALHVYSAVLSFVGVLKYPDDSLTDVFQKGRAVLVVSSIENTRRAAFEVEPEADLHAPIEEQTVANQGVTDLGGFLFEIVLGDGFALEDGQSGCFGISGDVGAKFGWDEAFDSGGDGGVDQGWLGVVGRDCGHEGIVALKGVDEGLVRAVVDFHRFGC